PHEFIEAFGSTLEESVYADLLLHVVDISNPNHKMQEEITIDLLKNKLKCPAPILTVYNKIDKLDSYEKMDGCLYVSAKDNKGIDNLKDTLAKILF
ncbi:MAG: GTPase HflX, partial [Clostridia bacterium]|nr:GTPase HflX [Clostridia bacterium]